MPRGKAIPKTNDVQSVETAIRESDWNSARHAMAVKLGRMFDHTDSARDVKSIAISLMPLVDACETSERGEVTSKTQLANIIEEAEKVLTNA